MVNYSHVNTIVCHLWCMSQHGSVYSIYVKYWILNSMRVFQWKNLSIRAKGALCIRLSKSVIVMFSQYVEIIRFLFIGQHPNLITLLLFIMDVKTSIDWVTINKSKHSQIWNKLNVAITLQFRILTNRLKLLYFFLNCRSLRWYLQHFSNTTKIFESSFG